MADLDRLLPPGRRPRPGRLRRLAEELEEVGFPLDHGDELKLAFLEELEYALRPRVHERRIPSYGAAIEPTVRLAGWAKPTQLEVTRYDAAALPLPDARRFADGLSSWFIRRRDGGHELAAFDRPAGSERDLTVIAEATGATLVQRHPAGPVRIVGPFGVFRWDGLEWHHEPPLEPLVVRASDHGDHGDPRVIEQLLAFAVHDLGALGIGTTLVYRPDDSPVPGVETRYAAPPPLHVTRPTDLALLRHALAQVDGAAVLDVTGTLRQIGVRLVPSAEAESDIDGYRGMRHTSARRYSFDDPRATLIVVSEDGPVTVLRAGELVGRSEPT